MCPDVVQERKRRKQHATHRAIEAEELQRAKSMARRQSMASLMHAFQICHWTAPSTFVQPINI